MILILLFVWITTYTVEGYLQPPIYSINSMEDWTSSRSAIETTISDTSTTRHVVMYSENATVLQKKDYLKYISPVFDKIDPEQTGNRIIIKIDNVPTKDLVIIGPELTKMLNLTVPMMAFHIYTFEEGKTTSKDEGLFLPTDLEVPTEVPAETQSVAKVQSTSVATNAEQVPATKKGKKDKNKNN